MSFEIGEIYEDLLAIKMLRMQEKQAAAGAVIWAVACGLCAPPPFFPTICPPLQLVAL